MEWYAILCGPNLETVANKALKSKGYNTFYPHTREWVESSRTKSKLVWKAYLPRYLFVADIHNFLEVNSAPGVSTAVYSGVDANGNRVPFPIPELVMRELFFRADHEGQIHLRKKRKTWFQGKSGDVIRFGETNPLWGLFATIEEVMDNGKRLKVLLENALAGQDSMIIETSAVGELIRA